MNILDMQRVTTRVLDDAKRQLDRAQERLDSVKRLQRRSRIAATLLAVAWLCYGVAVLLRCLR